MVVEKPLYGPETLISQHTNRPVSKRSEKKNSVKFWCGTCELKLDMPAIAITHMNGRSHKAKLNAKNKQDDASAPKRKHELESNQEPVTKKKKGKPVAVAQEPVAKKKKGKTVAPVAKDDPSLKCNDCNLVFQNLAAAIPHFKGKKHMAAIAAAATATKKSIEKAARDKDDPNLKCEDCNLVFRNMTSAIPHFKGKKHVAAIAAKLTAKQIQSQKKISGHRGRRGGGGGRGGWGRGRVDGIVRRLGGEGAAGELLRAMKNFYGRTDIYMPQNKEWRNVIDVDGNDNERGNYQHSTYGLPQQSKNHFVQHTDISSNIESNEDPYKDIPSKDKYDTHQVPLNYYGTPSNRDNYTGGSNYNRNGYTYSNEVVYMNTNDKYAN